MVVCISKFQFDQESVRQRTTLWMCYLQIIIYLLIYLFIEAILLFDVSVGVAVVTHCLMRCNNFYNVQ